LVPSSATPESCPQAEVHSRPRPDRRLPRGTVTPCPLIIPGCLHLPSSSLRSGRLHRPSPLFDPGCLRRPSPLLDCENQPFGFSAPMWKCYANTLHAIPPARADEYRFAVTRLLKAAPTPRDSSPQFDKPNRNRKARTCPDPIPWGQQIVPRLAAHSTSFDRYVRPSVTFYAPARAEL
jgi:hypothetical protein